MDAAPRPRLVSWFLPSIAGLIAGGAFWLALTPLRSKLFAADGDVGRHIRIGEWMLDHRAIPDVDHFSHTMKGRPFVPYEWLSEILYALSDRALGLAGAALLTALLFACSSWIVYRTTQRLGVGTMTAAVAALYSLLLQFVHVLARPHMFTMALTALWLLLLLEHRRGGRPLWAWLLPPIMLFWANLHGGFLVGFVMLGVFGADAWLADRRDRTPESRARLKTLALASGACLLASFVNPAGPELWLHCTGYLRKRYLIDITAEYQSPDFHIPELQAFMWGACLIVVLAALGRARFDFVDVALTVFWLSSSLYSARNIPLFAVVVVPLMGRWAHETVQSFQRAGPPLAMRLAARYVGWDRDATAVDGRATKPLVTVAFFIGVTAWAIANRDAPWFGFSREAFPVEALAKAREAGVRGNVLNQFHWGGYVLYAAPEVPVFIDGQTDFYGEELTREYRRAVLLEPGWQEILDRYRVDWTITDTGMPLNRALELLPGWRKLHSDATATVFVRR